MSLANDMGMIIAIVLSVVGTFVTLALGVNAFFLRGIFKDMGEVKITMAEISVRGEGKEKRIENLEQNEKEIFERLNIIEREVLK